MFTQSAGSPQLQAQLLESQAPSQAQSHTHPRQKQQQQQRSFRMSAHPRTSSAAGARLLEALGASFEYSHATTTSSNKHHHHLQSLITTETARARDARGRFALHIACENAAVVQLEVIQRLCRAWPEAVHARDEEEWLPLHHAAAACAAAGDEMSSPLLPLLPIVQYLVQQWPDSIQQTTNCGMLPLHRACMMSSSWGGAGGSVENTIVAYLVQKWPASVTVQNDLGEVPLHKACESGAPLSVLQCLVQEWPDAVKVVNHLGELPLHLLLVSGGSAERRQVEITDERTSATMPLSSRSAPTAAALASVDYVVNTWPAAVQQQTNGGELALHFACRHEAPLDIVKYLITQWPEAVKTVTTDGDLPLHLACASGASLEVVQYLVQEWPDSVRIHDCQDKTPLDLARHPFVFHRIRPNVVRWLDSVVKNGQIVSLVVEKQSQGKEERRRSSKRRSSSSASSFDKDRSHLLQVISGERDTPVSVHTKYVETLIKGHNVLGMGKFGVVVKGVDDVLAQEYAIKAIDSNVLVGASKQDLEPLRKKFKQEQQALLQVRHPNIALLYAYALSSHHHHGHYLLYELAEKGSLDKFWNTQLGRERLSSFPRRVQIVLDAFVGLRFLHVGNSTVRPSFHGDLKSSNIVLKRDMTAQLIDCGMASFASTGNGEQDDGKTSASVRGTLGYMCPKYCSGSIPFDASCDIFSFGIVLAELWCGRLQNHRDLNGRVYNYFDDYVDSDDPSSMEDDLDKALGVDSTTEIPWYMSRFADLAFSCMSPIPQKRPTGSEVLNRLEKIWSASRQDKSQADALQDEELDSLNESLQFAPENGDDSVCRICRTYAVEVGYAECQLCLALLQQRFAIAKAVPFELDASHTAPAVQEFAAMRLGALSHGSTEQPSDDPLLPIHDMRLNRSIPRLFVVLPAKRSGGHEQFSPARLETNVSTKFLLYFLCQDTLEAVSPPIPLTASKAWLEEIALPLAVSLTILQKCHASTSLHLPGGGCGAGGDDDDDDDDNNNNDSIDQQEVAEMLNAIKHMLQIKGDNEALDILERTKSGIAYSNHDMERLNGNAYELLVERAREEVGWRRGIQPVRKLFDIQVSWVSTIIAADAENKYEVIDDDLLV